MDQLKNWQAALPRHACGENGHCGDALHVDSVLDSLVVALLYGFSRHHHHAGVYGGFV